MRMHLAGALIALLTASFGASAMNRCTDATGKVSYSDKPCPGNDQQSRVTITKNSGFKGERAPARLDAGALEQPSRSMQQAAPQVAAGAGQSVEISRPSPTCSNAMRTYDSQATTRIKPNLIDMELSRKEAEEACGKRVPKMREQIVAEDEEEKRRLRQAVAAFCLTHTYDERCRP